MVEYRTSKGNFKFYNKNPFGFFTSDCVMRAISGATGLSWEQVIRELTELGISLGKPASERDTYDTWLQKQGWTKERQPRKTNKKKYTVNEFCKLEPKGIFVIGIANHLLFVEDGKYYDTWNCGDKTVGNYWSKKL